MDNQAANILYWDNQQLKPLISLIIPTQRARVVTPNRRFVRQNEKNDVVCPFAFFLFKNSSQMTSYLIIFEMHSRTGLGTKYLLLMWHCFGHTETVNQPATLSHAFSTPLTCSNTIDSQNSGLFKPRNKYLVRSNLAGALCRSLPHVDAHPLDIWKFREKTSIPPGHSESSSFTPRRVPEYHNKTMPYRGGGEQNVGS